MSEIDCESWTDVKCPYCRHTHRKEPEDMPWDDGADTEFQCDGCGAEFVCEAYVTTDWTTTEKKE